MKSLAIISALRSQCLNLITLTAVCGSLLITSCEETPLETMPVEKFTVAEIQIKSTATLPLLLGKDSLLNIVMSPENVTNKKLIWTSSNPEAVTVTEEGKVKALSVGTSIVSVSSTDGSARQASIIVQAIDHIDFISGITFTNTVSQIFEGETLALTVNIAPANATYTTLKWTSSNPQVATVSETGEVKGLDQGTVTITAAATDGSGVKQTTQVQIKEVIPVTGISFTTVLSETLAIGESIPLQIAVTPANATVSALDWKSSSPAVVSVSSSGEITSLADGQATISVTSKEGIKATISVTVEAGKINDTFFTGTNWRVATTGATGIVQDGKFKVTMAAGTKYRGDFRRNGDAVLHAGNFPIIAFKFNRPLGTGNVVFDTNNGSYLNGNNKLHTLIAKDGVQVHYANLATGTFGGSQVKLSTTATTTLSVFQLKVADFVLTADQIAAGGHKYEVHWVKTFKSLADLEAYINK